MNSQTINKLIRLILIISFLILSTHIIYQWLTKETVKPDALFCISFLFGIMINYFTWDNNEANDKVKEHVIRYSSRINYILLILVIFIVILVTEFPIHSVSEIQNIPLVIVLCLAIIILPTVEFILSRKYRKNNH